MPISNLRKKPVHYGVPQGSILGPLLFLIYINDLPLHIDQSDVDLYADDSTLHCHGASIEDINVKLQSDIIAIESWCKNNSMKINSQKTKCMKLCSKVKMANLSELEIQINGDSIENVHSYKLLGVTIDENLNWDEQVNKVCKIISSKISLLNKIKIFLPTHIRQLFYNAYILPYIDYCSSVWGNLSKNNSDRIDKLQKRAARIILDCDMSVPSEFMFSSLKWLSFINRVKYQKCILMYKIISNQTPDYLKLPNEATNHYNLRSQSNQNLFVPRPKTNFYKNSFHFSAVNAWNELPSHLKLCKNVDLFKNKCYEYFCLL